MELQPGRRRLLGRVVEVASGMPFERFLADRIFKPLGMIDTAFEVADARWPRMATVRIRRTVRAASGR